MHEYFFQVIIVIIIIITASLLTNIKTHEYDHLEIRSM